MHLIAFTPKSDLKKRVLYIAELSQLQQNDISAHPVPAIVIPILSAPADVKGAKTAPTQQPPSAALSFDVAKAHSFWLKVVTEIGPSPSRVLIRLIRLRRLMLCCVVC